MTKVIAKTYSLANEYRIRIAYILMAGCFAAAMVYAAYVYAAIDGAVVLQNINKEKAVIESSVMELDAEYIALSSRITPDMAKDYGLAESVASTYINRNTSLGRLTQASQGL